MTDEQLIERLTAENADLRRQLDAAILDIRNYPGITPCHVCKHYPGEGKGISQFCKLFDRSCFEWRGAGGGKEDEKT